MEVFQTLASLLALAFGVFSLLGFVILIAIDPAGQRSHHETDVDR
jgi:hypothetical protein